jgi:hypothetical protein
MANSTKVAIAGINVSTPKTEVALRKAVKTLKALNIIPTHNEFHQACRGAVKQTTNHNQQRANSVKLIQV